MVKEFLIDILNLFYWKKYEIIHGVFLFLTIIGIIFCSGSNTIEAMLITFGLSFLFGLISFLSYEVVELNEELDEIYYYK